MKLSISTNFADVARQVNDIGKQARFAAAVALTRTAQDVRAAIRDEMPRAFDRPTPYTLNSLMLRPAKKDNLEATVWVKDDPFASGTPADRFMAPQIFGGTRQQKRFEVLLQQVGALPPGWHAVPAAGARLDQYGNMSRGQIVQILSYFRGFSEQGYSKNITSAGKRKLKRGTRTKRGMEYFVSHGPGTRLKDGRIQQLPAGIWQRTDTGFGWAIKPVLLFVRRTSYRPRLRFFEIGQATADQRLPIHFDRELANALRTARG